jgi:MFS family permease
VGVGAVVLGLTSYVPTFAQGVLGAGPVTAGFVLATLTIGWPIAAALSGRLYLRIGFRLTALLGSALAIAGTIAVVLMAAAESLTGLAAACFVVGAGLGFIASPTLIAAQSSVGWSERGVVTGSNLFSRSLGSALAVAVLGAVANAVVDGQAGGAQPTGQLLADASAAVFVSVAVVAAVMVVAIALLPGRSASAMEDVSPELADASPRGAD